MKILALTKRQHTNKDLIDDSYGRVFEIPAELSLLGNEVKGHCLSYRFKSEGEFTWEKFPNLSWKSTNALPIGLIRYHKILEKHLDSWKPDLVWASSDAPHAILAHQWCRKKSIPLILDLYDNYESFKLSKIPGLVTGLRNACNYASLVTTVSTPLQQIVLQKYGRKGPTEVIPNGVNTNLFFPRNKHECRKKLGLPVDATLIGTAGALESNRGIEDLLKSFQQLSSTNPNLWLIIAGPRDSTIDKFKHPKLIDKGLLHHNEVPLLLSSLDVAVVCNKDSDFGRYCSPLKLMEIIAADIPVVAANVGDTPQWVNTESDSLYTPGNTLELATKVKKKLGNKKQTIYPQPLNWGQCTNLLLEKIHRAL